MWLYWIRAELERCVEICDKGIALSDQLGTEPVQYPTIKAMALMDLRADSTRPGTSLQQEVADEDHRFGAAVKQLGISVYLERVGAFDESFERALEALKEAQALNRTWMQRWLVDLLEVLAGRRGERQAGGLRRRVPARTSALRRSRGRSESSSKATPQAALRADRGACCRRWPGLGMRNATASIPETSRREHSTRWGAREEAAERACRSARRDRPRRLQAPRPGGCYALRARALRPQRARRPTPIANMR